MNLRTGTFMTLSLLIHVYDIFILFALNIWVISRFLLLKIFNLLGFCLMPFNIIV